MAAVLGVVALVAWAAFEVLLRPRGAAGSLRSDRGDRASTPLLIAIYALAAILPLALRSHSIGGAGDAAWAGVVLACAGLALRAWGMRTLGHSYSRVLRTSTGQGLITTGPYRWIRHPGYLGSIAVWTGASLSFGSWPSAVVVLVLMVLAYGWRIHAEELMLAEHFGAAYREYSEVTARLLPGIY